MFCDLKGAFDEKEGGAKCALVQSPPPFTSPPPHHHRRSPVTQVNLAGYLIAFLAVCWYNYQKLQKVKAKVLEDAKQELKEPEMEPLRKTSIAGTSTHRGA